MTRAYQEPRFILTQDFEFGRLIINQEKPCYGIVYLRMNNLKSDNVVQVCENLFRKDMEIYPHTIGVIEETRIRIRSLI